MPIQTAVSHPKLLSQPLLSQTAVSRPDLLLGHLPPPSPNMYGLARQQGTLHQLHRAPQQWHDPGQLSIPQQTADIPLSHWVGQAGHEMPVQRHGEGTQSSTPSFATALPACRGIEMPQIWPSTSFSSATSVGPDQSYAHAYLAPPQPIYVHNSQPLCAPNLQSSYAPNPQPIYIPVHPQFTPPSLPLRNAPDALRPTNPVNAFGTPMGASDRPPSGFMLSVPSNGLPMPSLVQTPVSALTQVQAGLTMPVDVAATAAPQPTAHTYRSLLDAQPTQPARQNATL